MNYESVCPGAANEMILELYRAEIEIRIYVVTWVVVDKTLKPWLWGSIRRGALHISVTK